MKYVYNTLAILLSVFVLVGANSTLLAEQSALAMFGMLGLVLVFLSRPMIVRWKDSWLLRSLDYLLIAATVVSFGYVFVQSEPSLKRFWVDGIMLGDRAGNETALDFAMAGVGMLLVLEATRRAIGWTLPILCLLFIVYAFYGQDMPEWLFPHRGYDWQAISQKTFLQYGGVFGIALRVMFFYVFLFVLFGTVLEQTGATGYVIQFARRLFHNSIGGPAKVAVVSSGLMGSLSGSAVANTATTGTFTIPLMKSSGFKANTAGGVEAAASSGGALMPPIMGAGAYMMLEMVDPPVTYVQIIQAALIPALMYYGALLLTVHFHAKRVGVRSEAEKPVDVKAVAKAAEQESEPSTVAQALADEDGYSAYQGVVFFGSFVVLIGFLLANFTPYLAVSCGLIGVIVLSMFSSSTRLTPNKMLTAMVDAAKSGVALIVAASCVGIILGVVQLTGIGAALPPKILSLAGDSVIAALLLLMLSTIVLGMGLPSAVCYLLMAYLLGPMLTDLGTPPLAAHLFIFYFGMMSMVTPPVALAAYAAAAISKGDVLGTAIQAFRFSLVGFALPFSFVLNPELLMLTPDNQPASWPMTLIAISVASIAVYGLAAAIAGYATDRLSWLVRAIWFALSMAIFFTRGHGIQFQVQLACAGMLLTLCVVEWWLRRE